MAKVLVIGSGGREQALAWKLAQSSQVDKVYIAPGNGGSRGKIEKIDINFEYLAPNQPEDPNMIRTHGDNMDPYDIELTQSALIDSKANKVPVATRTIAQSTARRVLRLKGNYANKLRAIKETDLSDLHRLFSYEDYDEAKCITYISDYLQTSQGFSASDATTKAIDELTEAKKMVSAYSEIR